MTKPHSNAVRFLVEMAGIEPASERFDPRKSTSVAYRNSYRRDLGGQVTPRPSASLRRI